MKNIINAILGFAGYTIQKKKKNFFKSGGLLYPFAQTLLTSMDIKDFTLVQVGANLGLDGKLNDPIKKFIQNNPQIKGILIEPMIEYLDVVKEIYSNNSNLNFENIAIGKEIGNLNLLRFKPGISYNKDFYDGLATFKENRVDDLRNRAKRDNTESYLEEINVPVFPATYLKQKYKLNEIEILQVDTEGYDLIIIESFFSSGLFPKIINFEYTELTELELNKGLNMFKDYNYELFHNGSDILAISPKCKIFD